MPRKCLSGRMEDNGFHAEFPWRNCCSQRIVTTTKVFFFFYKKHKREVQVLTPFNIHLVKPLTTSALDVCLEKVYSLLVGFKGRCKKFARVVNIKACQLWQVLRVIFFFLQPKNIEDMRNQCGSLKSRQYRPFMLLSSLFDKC